MEVQQHMKTASHTDKRKSLLALCLVAGAALVLMFAFAATASAEPSYTEFCSDCHNVGVGPTPTVQVTSAVGADPVTYSVHQTSYAWAAFDLTDNSTRIAGDGNSDSSFTAPLGHYVRVCCADGNSTGTWTQAYIVTPTAKAGGTISPNANEVVAPSAASKTYTITPDAGYHIADVTINGVSNPGAVAAGSYQAPNVTGDVAIVATFAPTVATYTLTPSAGPNGAISPATVQTVNAGDSKTFTITPNAGYKVADVLVNGVSKGAITTYQFTNVQANGTIAASFAVKTTTVTLSKVKLSGLHGSVLTYKKTMTASGTVTPASLGGKVTLTAQRKSGSTWLAASSSARTLTTKGTYSWSYKPTKKASYRIQATIAATGTHAAASSVWTTFSVK